MACVVSLPPIFWQRPKTEILNSHSTKTSGWAAGWRRGWSIWVKVFLDFTQERLKFMKHGRNNVWSAQLLFWVFFASSFTFIWDLTLTAGFFYFFFKILRWEGWDIRTRVSLNMVFCWSDTDSTVCLSFTRLVSTLFLIRRYQNKRYILWLLRQKLLNFMLIDRQLSPQTFSGGWKSWTCLILAGFCSSSNFK